MRVNVYEEEISDNIEFVSTEAKTGKIFWGVRIFVKSAPQLHDTPNDDDRSAITFWLHDKKRALEYFQYLTNTLKGKL
jgi:hypothetical protein